jgi:hypothetical protein
MANTPILQLVRGSGATRTVSLPISLYVTGSTLRFTAKPAPDNDLTDAAAVINKTFNDSDVDTSSNPLYAIYTMTFIPSDTTGITFDTSSGQTQIIYAGQIKYTPLGGEPVYYPGSNNYIQVIIDADIPRETP